MAYSIPVPEHRLCRYFLDYLPLSAERVELRSISGRVTLAGRLRKLGILFPLRIEFEPSASVPEEADVTLEWRVRRIRPFISRWILRSESGRQAGSARFESQPDVVRISLESLLEGLPAWHRLPFPLRRTLRLQHWWMPNNGGGLFLVFSKEPEALVAQGEVASYEKARVPPEVRIES